MPSPLLPSLSISGHGCSSILCRSLILFDLPLAPIVQLELGSRFTEARSGHVVPDQVADGSWAARIGQKTKRATRRGSLLDLPALIDRDTNDAAKESDPGSGFLMRGGDAAAAAAQRQRRVSQASERTQRVAGGTPASLPFL